MNPRLGKIKENSERICDFLRESAQSGARLVVFPECALTGYAFETREEALACSLTVDSLEVANLCRMTEKENLWSVVGSAERTDDRLFNSLFLIGHGKVQFVYRKVHLPYIGLDRFANPGDGPLQAVETPVGRLGLHICYDAIFPEVARVLTLDKAEILCLSTNWPEGARPIAQVIPIARTLENRVCYVVSNRVGCEGGFRFIGQSQIVNFDGTVLSRAGEEEETVLVQTLDLEPTRRKRIVFEPGRYEVDRVGDRRPELYQLLTEGRVTPTGTE